jgi:hypothetical protein
MRRTSQIDCGVGCSSRSENSRKTPDDGRASQLIDRFSRPCLIGSIRCRRKSSGRADERIGIMHAFVRPIKRVFDVVVAHRFLTRLGSTSLVPHEPARDVSGNALRLQPVGMTWAETGPDGCGGRMRIVSLNHVTFHPCPKRTIPYSWSSENVKCEDEDARMRGREDAKM